MTWEEVQKQYAGEWVALNIEREAPPNEGRVLLHHADRHEFDRLLLAQGLKDVYITFAGELVKPGYSVLFVSWP